MYTECYDEKHKILEVSRSKENVVKKQKGFYGSFMCEECEEETQKYDHYASLILTDLSTNADEYIAVKKMYFCENYKGQKEGKAEFGKWENINFRKFQRCVFSIVLRTYFAGKIEGHISLNKKHLEGIFAIYRNELNLDDFSYPILITKYPKNDKLKNHVILPYIDKQEGHHIIAFTGGGYFFKVYVSGHSKPEFVKTLRLKSDGSMYLLIMFFQETGYTRNR